MRGYNVAASAVALDVDYKWLDNLLSHFWVAGVRQARQGVARTLPFPALRVIAIAQQLTSELGAPLPRALELAQTLAEGKPIRAGNLEFSADLTSLDTWLSERLAYAVEVAPTPRRGRPPRQ